MYMGLELCNFVTKYVSAIDYTPRVYYVAGSCRALAPFAFPVPAIC